ncbi:MAG: ANTAR domain-containing protein, partial [Clostridiales bacterium]|nr:ANTAR domain-containing protein [Clostridiales bacterium]
IENEELKNQLKSIKLVNKAKSILMTKGFSETNAHKYIQKTAMNLRLSKLETANLIIKNKIDI